MNATLSALLPGANGTLHATLIRSDGTHRDLGLIAGGRPTFLAKPLAWWRSLWMRLRHSHVIPVAMCFAAFLEIMLPAAAPGRAVLDRDYALL